MKKTPQHLLDEAVRLYVTGLSSTEISEIIGIHASTISAAVRRAGITRTHAEAKAAQYLRKPPKVVPPEAGKVYGAPDGKKECPACLLTFPADLEHFYKRTRENGRAYLTSLCQGCVKSKISRARAADPEKSLALNRESYRKNGKKYNATKRDKFAADPALRAARLDTTRLWLEKNKGYLITYRVAYRMAMGEVLRERSRLSRAKVPKERKRAVSQLRKALKRGALGRYTGDDLKAQYVKQNGLCFWCNDALDDTYHADHYIPLIKGGTNFPENIVLSCPTCNISKGGKMPDEYLTYREFIKENAEMINAKRIYMREAMRRHRAKKSTSKTA